MRHEEAELLPETEKQKELYIKEELSRMKKMRKENKASKKQERMK